ncbi:uncharacterized protein KRP23_10447 [Phytophthora ramorum]|uniref:uncharacterized protein n=1 Tax=Phytophthora ramorum TaxID=164328 RepID=UPI0030985ECB|nr:hypothetical protein KRP23_10447 [Phytophthora ramorum]
MGVMAKFFTLMVFVGRMVVKLLRMGAARLVDMSRHLPGVSRIDLPNGEQQLLGTESIDNAEQKNLADDWVSVAEEEDKWETGGRNLLDENGKRSREASESTTEDELIELSDGEERPSLIAALRPVKHIRPVSMPHQVSTASTTTTLL